MIDSAEFLARRLQVDPQPEAELKGSSGFFSRPDPSFDPQLIENGKLRPEVREAVLKALYDFWEQRYEKPRVWSTVWIAGSAISHQWSADRGNGDLDVLIGVDHAKFLQYNPDFQGIPSSTIDQRFNAEFFQGLDKQTAQFKLPGWKRTMEATFYVNKNAADIRDIHPYAAYNVSRDEWTVGPPELPANWDPRTDLPSEWWPVIDAEITHARDLVERYRSAAAEVSTAPQRSPARVNALRKLDLVSDQGTALFDEIHNGRKEAFGAHGAGYYDYQTARYQSHKGAGTMDALRQIKVSRANATIDVNREKYGTQVLGADQAMTEASLWATKFRADVGVLVPKEQ